MADVRVRPAHYTDLDQMTDLMYEYIVDFYKRPKPPLEKVHSIFHLLLFHQQGIQFVAEKDGKLVGFTTLYFTYNTTRADKITVMNDLYVVEEIRGTGVAADLFRACESYTKENGYFHMTWVTASDNKRAQRFYDKMGGKTADWVNYSIS